MRKSVHYDYLSTIRCIFGNKYKQYNESASVYLNNLFKKNEANEGTVSHK